MWMGRVLTDMLSQAATRPAEALEAFQAERKMSSQVADRGMDTVTEPDAVQALMQAAQAQVSKDSQS